LHLEGAKASCRTGGNPLFGLQGRPTDRYLGLNAPLRAVVGTHSNSYGHSINSFALALLMTTGVISAAAAARRCLATS